MEKVFNLTAALEREVEIKDRLAAMADVMESENRELNDAESAEKKQLMRELNTIGMRIAAHKATSMQNREQEKTPNEQFREGLRQVRDRQVREITFAGQVTDAGTIAINQHDVIASLNEGLGLPVGCNVVTGVTGNDIWPVSVNDVDLEEVGENVALGDSSFDFDKITPLVKRAGLAIPVSNKAIDEATFDILSYTVGKIRTAKARYLAARIYSQANWGTGNVAGPFSGLTKAGTITLDASAYKNILAAVAKFTDLGLQGTPCLIMDAVTEANLKATPKAAGQGGFIIENGKCAGYDYVVSHFINTEMGSDNTLVATANRYLGIGYFNYLAVQQHGTERLGLDNSSTAVMIKNEVRYVYNSEFSITDLSTKLNKKGGTTTQAFAIYELADAE